MDNRDSAEARLAEEAGQGSWSGGEVQWYSQGHGTGRCDN